MSRLKELIDELCPEGVEYRTIGSFSECLTGATPKKSHPEYWENGSIPWMSSGEVHERIVTTVAGRITAAGYDSCSTRMVPAGTVVVALAGQGKTRGSVAITAIELCTNQSLASIIPDATVDNKYLFYALDCLYQYLRQISSGEGTRGGLNLPTIREVRIPVPPIEVQREIVRVLDAMQELCDALAAEINLRNTQLSYCSEYLSTDWLVHQAVVSETVTLKDACKFLKAGGDVPKDCIKGQDQPDDVRPYPVISNGMDDSAIYGYSSSYVIDEPAVTIAARGSIGYHEVREGKFTPVVRLLTLVPKADLLPRYLDLALEQCDLRGTQGGIPQLTVPMIKDQTIQIPSIETQKVVVDQVESIRMFISVLCDELEMRKHQFACYRDKLLDFPERAVS